MIPALAALLGFQLLGELLVRALGLPVPGALLGLVFLVAYLMWRGETPQSLADTSNALLRNMMLLLVPSVVGLIDNVERVRREWLPFVVACVVGAVITLAVTAVVLEWLLKRQPPEEGV
ncbi:CidA/LrgA family protein [Paracidovorax wautersii]|uniref:Holin-like protein n=1 Tax=Paracidovorax wautersii TaxID=1177982 RepID=A0ABU1IDL7_9BURK|nr:CidA/LrgA family protein [Paracidovorax wautersii]MDR6215325.1 holin-like protein [Paracidovorax wautersii]